LRAKVARMSYDATLRIRRFFSRFAGPVDNFGEQALFYGESMRYIPNALTRYRKETIRLIAEMTMGTGALVLIGGTVGVAAFLTLASGGVIAVQGYQSLGNIGIEALTGFLSAFLNVRIVARVVAGIALAATIGAGTTAQLQRTCGPHHRFSCSVDVPRPVRPETIGPSGRRRGRVPGVATPASGAAPPRPSGSAPPRSRL
jgi:Permease MlaE